MEAAELEGNLGAEVPTAFDERIMEVSRCAGKPAQASMLVNVPRLITAYHADFPDPSVPEQRVAFGTSGHRILEEAQMIVRDALAASPQQPAIPSDPERKEKR